MVNVLDDFIINDSYDAYEDEFEEGLRAWRAYYEEELVEESDDLKN